MIKILPILFVILVLLLIGNFYYEKTTLTSKSFTIGVSFSPDRARNLSLDWKITYLNILDNLKVRNLRLGSYWSTLQPSPEQYYFDDLDYQINQAQKYNTQVLLVLGAKQPGWPECYAPAWAKSLTLTQRQQKSLDFIQTVVERYRANSSIKAWQVENEPLFAFGAVFSFGYQCDSQDGNFLKQEIALVKKLDPTRPVVVTDSGELSTWVGAMQASDIFGTTMYRTVHNPIFGYSTYPLSPSFYTLRSNLIRNLFARNNQKTIITELQAEPWFSEPSNQVPVNTQADIFSAQNLTENVDYAKKTGFDEVYLWGVEWWYYMAKNGHPEYLNLAKKLF
ncbi:MAG: glycoside hydrolase family 2 TIM barrel-domain containing protein [Candidatus Daviesbacteria bacterium]|nr:glycoside hydrolase family 2 TIM barrel-domain containing protein [Candidatus Daviesbacteria bacterium]